MNLKKLFAVVFVALVMLFLFSTLVIATDWPTNPKGPKDDPLSEHPWDDVNMLAPGHNPWQGVNKLAPGRDPWDPAFYEHIWDEVKRPDPKHEEHPWEEVESPWPTMAHAWGEEN